MFTVTKIYRDLPAAHRQPNHPGHCRLIHGHNWGFDITFACTELNACGFVVDVGELKVVKEFLTDKFDHTLLLNRDDNAVLENNDFLIWLHPMVKITLVLNCGMEGLAEYVCTEINNQISFGNLPGKGRGLHVCQVTCWEDSKNSATYQDDHLRNVSKA